MERKKRQDTTQRRDRIFTTCGMRCRHLLAMISGHTTTAEVQLVPRQADYTHEEIGMMEMYFYVVGQAFGTAFIISTSLWTSM